MTNDIHPPFQLRLFTSGLHGIRSRQFSVLAALCGAALMGATAVPAFAASSGSTTATVNVIQPVRSIIVQQPSVQFANCSGGNSTSSEIGFPNGTCTSPGVTINNTGATLTIARSRFILHPYAFPVWEESNSWQKLSASI